MAAGLVRCTSKPAAGAFLRSSGAPTGESDQCGVAQSGRGAQAFRELIAGHARQAESKIAISGEKPSAASMAAAPP